MRSIRYAILSLVAATLLLGTSVNIANAEGGKGMGLRSAWKKVREEFQVYKGNRIERMINRFRQGRSTFNKKLSVKENLKSLVEKHNIPHYYGDVGGKKVLHVVVDLAQGKKTSKVVRQIMANVGQQTIELNYKAAGGRNPYGHVAVRVGSGATYDLTGSRGVEKLPPLLAKGLKFLTGSADLSMARRRNLRHFMETRKNSDSASVYFGMLFSADAKEIKATETVYSKRMKQMTAFSVGGGDASKGVYSCAQFLTENVPFLNTRGIGAQIGARGTASSAAAAQSLEAVVVYKTAKVEQSSLPRL